LRSKTVERQIVLVSYGTQYLRGKIALDDWHRHGTLFNARLQFRALADNGLLADDFTLWLGILKAAGATRLSLHLAAAFEVDVARADKGGVYAVVVHFPDRHQIWVVGQEQATWLSHPLFPGEEGQGYPVFPDAACYGGPIDSYWWLEDRAGQLEVPDTDWKALARAIATDLESPVPSSLAPGGPYFGPLPHDVPWAKFPLFPSSNFTSLAHRIMSTLARMQSTFSNDTNPKNESNPYQFLDQEGAAKLTIWGRRLDSWMLEVQLRCANETRSFDLTGKNTPLARVHTAPPPHQNITDDGAEEDASSPDVPAEQSASTSNSKWGGRIAFIVKVALGSLAMIFLARLVASYPWLAVPIVALWMLAARLLRHLPTQ
jgi:hypothetical protein